MKSRARYARMSVWALLLLSSVLVLATTTTTSAASVLGVAKTNSTTITVTTTNSTTITVTTRATTSLTLTDVTVIPGYVSVPSEMIPAMIFGFVTIVLALLVSALILRSRSSRALDELDGQRRLVHEIRTQPSVTAPAGGLTAASALKRLLELGVLQPKEYMEKKMLAERLEKKMSAKQLLDEGLISQEQYDALTRKQGVEE